MNRDVFLRYVENTRDCEQYRLDMAVNRGLCRAKNDRFDSKKMFVLAAACVFSFVSCVIVNLRPVKLAVELYYRNWHTAMPGSAEMLDGYVKDLAGNFRKYSGGE